jgi:hypothetical protein
MNKPARSFRVQLSWGCHGCLAAQWMSGETMSMTLNAPNCSFSVGDRLRSGQLTEALPRRLVLGQAGCLVYGWLAGGYDCCLGDQ